MFLSVVVEFIVLSLTCQHCTSNNYFFSVFRHSFYLELQIVVMLTVY